MTRPTEGKSIRPTKPEEGVMPKRWSIVLTLQHSDDRVNWVDEGEPYQAVSDVYEDNKKKDVEDKKNRIKKKAESEK